MAINNETANIRLKNLKPGKNATSFTSDNQPTPEQKSKGWEERRKERLLT